LIWGEKARCLADLIPIGELQKAMRKRSVWVEPLFAEGKEWHGMRRFRLRRVFRVNGEALMRAAGQNLKRLLKKRGWGRRPWPEGAANALVEPPSPDHIYLHAPSLAEQALACGEKLRVKCLLKPLGVWSLDNIAFVPASLLFHKGKYQTIANNLPGQGVLICRTEKKERITHILERVADFFRQRGHFVKTLPYSLM